MNAAGESIQITANRVIAKSVWRNDFVGFQIGARVLIRPVIDIFQHTRVRSLYDHFDNSIYIVSEILQFNKVKLILEENNVII